MNTYDLFNDCQIIFKKLKYEDSLIKYFDEDYKEIQIMFKKIYIHNISSIVITFKDKIIEGSIYDFTGEKLNNSFFGFKNGNKIYISIYDVLKDINNINGKYFERMTKKDDYIIE